MARPPTLAQLSPEWETFRDKVEAVMRRVDELAGGIYLIFQPDPYTDSHVGLGRRYCDTDQGWETTSMGLVVPERDRALVRVDQDGMWDEDLRGASLEQVAHAFTMLVSYTCSSPSALWPTFRDDVEPEQALPPEVLAAITAELAGSDVKPLPERGQQRPAGRLIRTPHDAELSAADWMCWLGYTNVGVTDIGSDAGIDVHSDQAIAQVKMEGVKTGRPIVQNAYGVAMAEGKQALVFSLGGFLLTAVEWAEKVQLPLFQFDLQGEPIAVNDAARRLLAQA